MGKQECRQIPRQECRKVPRQSCQKIPRQKCQKVPKQECRQEPRQKCQNVPRQECRNVPKYLRKSARLSTFAKYVSNPLTSAEGNDSALYTIHHSIFIHIFYAAIILSQFPQHPGS